MTAPEPTPLRDRIAEALRTTPSELLDHPEDRARFAANSRKRHDRHNYSMDCAMCRSEVDTLADAVLTVVQPQLDRLTAERDAALGAVERTAQMMHDYNAAARQRGEVFAHVNCRQVINLLSLTWPDGNYAGAPDVH